MAGAVDVAKFEERSSAASAAASGASGAVSGAVGRGKPNGHRASMI